MNLLLNILLLSVLGLVFIKAEERTRCNKEKEQNDIMWIIWSCLHALSVGWLVMTVWSGIWWIIQMFWRG